MDKQHIKMTLENIVKDILEEDESFPIDSSKSLIDNYNLDSLDLLDLAFNIEAEFGVKIGANELSGNSRTTLSEDEMIDENGYITECALEELRRNIPEIPPENIRYGLRQNEIPRLLNIDVFTRIVQDKLKDTGK